MRGLVLEVDARTRTLVVSTEKVEGFMSAMTMRVEAARAEPLDRLRPGTAIEFEYVVDGPRSRAERIRMRPYQSLEQEPLELRRLRLLSRLAEAPEAAVKPLAPGEAVPDFTLVDHQHRPLSLSALAGKVVAITFTYLRCPNPAYCFRLASNFGQLQKRFAARMGRDLVLLTIVIDPEHDVGDALAEYARIWTTSPAWRFLTGPPEEVRRVAARFGVDFWKDEGLLVHSFGTAVVDRRGRVAAILEGNQYSAKQLGDLVQAVIGRP